MSARCFSKKFFIIFYQTSSTDDCYLDPVVCRLRPLYTGSYQFTRADWPHLFPAVVERHHAGSLKSATVQYLHPRKWPMWQSKPFLPPFPCQTFTNTTLLRSVISCRAAKHWCPNSVCQLEFSYEGELSLINYMVILKYKKDSIILALSIFKVMRSCLSNFQS